jgi:hypothetical protein
MRKIERSSQIWTPPDRTDLSLARTRASAQKILNLLLLFCFEGETGFAIGFDCEDGERKRLAHFFAFSPISTRRQMAAEHSGLGEPLSNRLRYVIITQFGQEAMIT